VRPEQDTDALAARLHVIERDLEVVKRALKVRGPWVSVGDAARELGKSTHAFYMWRQRHGIVAQNGFITRADLDRAIQQRKPARVAPTGFRKRVG
jgi:hypothetical protein